MSFGDPGSLVLCFLACIFFIVFLDVFWRVFSWWWLYFWSLLGTFAVFLGDGLDYWICEPLYHEIILFKVGGHSKSHIFLVMVQPSFCGCIFIIFVRFGKALGSLESSLGSPWASFGHLFGVVLACSNVDVNRLPVDSPSGSSRWAKWSKRVSK